MPTVHFASLSLINHHEQNAQYNVHKGNTHCNNYGKSQTSEFDGYGLTNNNASTISGEEVNGNNASAIGSAH